MTGQFFSVNKMSKIQDLILADQTVPQPLRTPRITSN